MSLRKALLAATVLAMPLAAQAQPVSGLYIAGGGGANLRTQSVAGGLRISSENPGGVGVVSLGYGFGNGLRLEAEGNYRHNDVERTNFLGQRVSGRVGYLRTYGVMGNVFYDINIPGVPVVPYVGAGVGYAWTDVNNLRFSRRVLANGTGPSVLIDKNDGNLAYQGIAGVAYSLGSMVPGLALTAEYRYFATTDAQVRGFITPVGGARPTASGFFRVENQNHSFLVGLRYAFGAPRPAPVVIAPVTPPPPVGVARTYLVFFDWDRADLTGRAREIIAQAAANARSTSTTRIEVAGHADRSGTPQYNQRLSQRRAEVVAAELVRNGVPRGAIGVTAFGESRPLVPTADGVREPQNRRVEIVLR